jgi:hypothetical protein
MEREHAIWRQRLGDADNYCRYYFLDAIDPLTTLLLIVFRRFVIKSSQKDFLFGGRFFKILKSTFLKVFRDTEDTFLPKSFKMTTLFYLSPLFSRHIFCIANLLCITHLIIDSLDNNAHLLLNLPDTPSPQLDSSSSTQ